MKSLVLVSLSGALFSLLVGALPSPNPQSNEPRITLPFCPSCIPSPNNCDITAPCAQTFHPPSGTIKTYCACRAGYKATGIQNDDITKQWRLNDGGYPWDYRVYVAPGVECNTLCDNWTGSTPCSEVSYYDSCPVYT